MQNRDTKAEERDRIRAAVEDESYLFGEPDESILKRAAGGIGVGDPPTDLFTQYGVDGADELRGVPRAYTYCPIPLGRPYLRG